LGFFAGLDAEAYDRSYRDVVLLRRLAAYFRPQAGRVRASVLTMAVMSAAGAASPILVSRGIDLLAAGAAQASLLATAGALFALGALVWVMNWIRRRATARAIAEVILELRREAFAATAGHDMSFYDEYSSGRVVSRISSDTSEFAQMVVLLTDVLTQLAQVAILVVVLLRIEWKLTLWLLAMLPPILLVAISFRRLARRVTQRGMRAMANVTSAIKEAVTGISVAKNFRQEPAIYQQFGEVNRQAYGVNVRRGIVLAMVFPCLNALMGVGTALLTYMGGLSAAQGAVALGAWYLFMRSLDRFWFPILNLSSFWSQLQGGLSAAERVFALIDAESAVIQIEARPVPPLRGRIQFEDLDFHYRPGEPVLRGFSLSIEPGENLALVGHTGAGKSSIAKMITRFYEFQDGSLLVDGMDIRSLDLRQYRRQIGVVPQNPFLFSGTVLDNIRYANPSADEGEVEALARRIGGGEWLESLPAALQSEVGERGSWLSMGQRQLVSLMRVLVQRPAIFILDEATASIDPFTEAQIQEALSLVLSETTSILIAHRLTTVRSADRIIVLRTGEIIEQGTHRSLLEGGGHYAELYNTYFRHQSLEYVEAARRGARAAPADAA
jgi:ATP-binding cassette subfamily B protein